MSWRVMGRLLLRRRLGRDGCDDFFFPLDISFGLFVLYLEKRCARLEWQMREEGDVCIM